MLSAHLASKAHISTEMPDDYPEKLWRGGWRAKHCFCCSSQLAIEKENWIKYSKSTTRQPLQNKQKAPDGCHLHRAASAVCDSQPAPAPSCQKHSVKWSTRIINEVPECTQWSVKYELNTSSPETAVYYVKVHTSKEFQKDWKAQNII